MATILVVDRDPGVRRTALIALEYANHEVMEAADSDTAARLVKEIPFDLIAADYRAIGSGPGGPGWIRDIDRSVPLLALCAGGHGAEFSDAASLGADRLLAKPFRSRELLSVVCEMLARRRRPATTAAAVCGGEARPVL